MANTINVTSDTVVKLIIRRGTNTDRQTIVLASGELGYAIDTKRVYVGDGVTLGGNLVGSKNFGIVQGIQQYIGVAQPGDFIYQNVTGAGENDNVLYTFSNGQWVSVSPQYSSSFTYTGGVLNFNPNYLVLDTVNSILNVYNSVNTSTLSANTATIYNQPVFGTDGANKLYVDTSIANAEALDQAYTRNYVGNNYVPLSGQATLLGTLSSTANVSVSTAPVLNADVTNKLYVDTSVANALNKAEAFTSGFLPLSGGTLTNTLTSYVTRNDTSAITVLQYGSAPAIVVQDTNRSTPQSFFVDNYGSVGIGVRPPSGGTTQLSVLGTVSASNVITSTSASFINVYGTNGYLGVNNSNPQHTLDVNGNSYISGSQTTAGELIANGSAVITGTLTVNGSVSATGDVVAFTTSDTRLKTNITPVTDALDKLDQINGVYFDWNTDLQSVHSGHDIGVLAQEIEDILPEAVITRPDGYKAVRYEKLIPLLIQAIKELKVNRL